MRVSAHSFSQSLSRQGFFASTSLPDQIRIAISATSGVASNLDDITRVLTQAGMAGASFSNLHTAYTYDDQGNPSAFLQWSFTFPTPLATLNNTIGRLLSAAEALSKQKLGIVLLFSTGASLKSAQAQPACSQTALVAERHGPSSGAGRRSRCVRWTGNGNLGRVGNGHSKHIRLYLRSDHPQGAP